MIRRGNGTPPILTGIGKAFTAERESQYGDVVKHADA